MSNAKTGLLVTSCQANINKKSVSKVGGFVKGLPVIIHGYCQGNLQRYSSSCKRFLWSMIVYFYAVKKQQCRWEASKLSFIAIINVVKRCLSSYNSNRSLFLLLILKTTIIKQSPVIFLSAVKFWSDKRQKQNKHISFMLSSAQVERPQRQVLASDGEEKKSRWKGCDR